MKYLLAMQQAIAYIESNLTERLTLEDAAESAGFSPYHFHRIFQANVRTTKYLGYGRNLYRGFMRLSTVPMPSILMELVNSATTMSMSGPSWLPKSGCQLDEKDGFELYGERFLGGDDERSEVDLYIAIK